MQQIQQPIDHFPRLFCVNNQSSDDPFSQTFDHPLFDLVDPLVDRLVGRPLNFINNDSPHGSNFEDVVSSLASLMPLDRGIDMVIHGKSVIACMFTMCYLGDMLQQEKNSGCKGPRGLKFCRFCYVESKQVREGDVLRFDTCARGRYHFQHIKMRNTLRQQRTAAAKTSKPRPPDPAHSEFKGLTNLMHEMLHDVILKPSSKAAYTRIHSHPSSLAFPSWMSRLQNPHHYRMQYSLSARGRRSIVVPALLRDWLTKAHVNKFFYQAVADYKPDTVTDFDDPIGSARNGQALALATQTDVPMSDVGSDVEMDDPNESSSVADAPAGLGTGFMD
uniref:Uncharacterized protein n=1 Tax=Fusarium oxysporum (strain Fo5176) TaxID=660025 RepID=A0A0D2YD98_FUSOF